MSSIVAVCYIIVNVLLSNFDSPLANAIIPHAPYAYFMFSIVIILLLTTKLIGENKAFNKLAKDQNIILEEKNIELQRFTHVASHDLKTPIRNISNFASLVDLNLKRKNYTDIPKHIEYIKVNTSHMFSLTDDLLSFSMIERKEQEGSRGLIGLNIITSKVALILKSYLFGRNAKLIIRDLPSYICNETEFYILFQNLIQNGIKYNESDVPTVEIWSTTEEKELRLYFKDNGIGIEKEFHSQIFEIFSRLHSKDEYEGTGFGLGFCERIVHKHKGTIRIKSELGKGSIFTVCLPLISIHAQPKILLRTLKPSA